MSLLENVNSAEDVKKLNMKELEALAEEIRGFLIDRVSKHGGHLASNLGTVELTLALHKVFDASRDKIVWDVGHQSYTHKIVTGRRDDFDTLRKRGGLSGFPKTSESALDAFNTGHSSTSVSAALGFAKAFEMRGEPCFGVAVIGDGALTGGMAYEALNHAGSGTAPLIVVLNDNGMSIAPNVGGLARYLEKLSGTAEYIGIKGKINKFLKELPFAGKQFRNVIRRGKRVVKKLLVQKKLFENMGLEYLGPVNGHDLRDLVAILEYAKGMERPVVVHVRTKKGKGYAPAEKNPSVFHGVGEFDPDTGELSGGGVTYSKLFGKTACALGRENERILCITAAMPAPTGLSEFARSFPKRFFDVGIAEGHAVTFASALAAAGYVPIFAVYSTFLQRGYDQLLHDAALQNLHIVLAIDRAGAVGSDGETHQGIYDTAYLSHIPNMTVMAPSCGAELEAMIRFAAEKCEGPVAVRYPKGAADCGTYGDDEITLGRGVCLFEGRDAVIAALGSEVAEAVRAAKILEGRGISVGVMNVRFVKPFDGELLRKMTKGCKMVVSAEDGLRRGGLAAAVREEYGGHVLALGFDDAPLEQASVAEQKNSAGLDAEGMADRIEKEMGKFGG